MTTLLDSYDSVDSNYGITTRLGQSFKLSQSALITSAKFRLFKAGSPTGNITAEIWAHTGTFGSGGKPTGSALAVSDPIDASTIVSTPSNALYEFTFSTPYTVTNGIPFVLVVAHASDLTNYVYWTNKNTSPAHAGNGSRYLSGWIEMTVDFSFYLYGNYVGASITGIQSITGVSSITF